MSDKVTTLIFHKSTTGKYKYSLTTALKLAKLLDQRKIISSVAISAYLSSDVRPILRHVLGM
jgi:DNA-binding XRE family transcriptional regulator